MAVSEAVARLWLRLQGHEAHPLEALCDACATKETLCWHVTIEADDRPIGRGGDTPEAAFAAAVEKMAEEVK